VAARADCSDSARDFSLMAQKLSRTTRVVGAALVVLLLPLILPLAFFSLTLWSLHRIVLYLLIWLVWLPRGKDVLFVYSDSPIWREYMTTQVLPLVQKRAVVLNWSDRSRWPRLSFRVHVFRSFGGDREFNPLIVLFRPWRRARALRFWSAFKGWKHGCTEPVESLRQELVCLL
jgi:hypothetical protein